jgi:dihydroorotase
MLKNRSIPHELLVRGGRICDPSCGRDEIADLAIRDGRFVDQAELVSPEIVDASGLVVAPGFIDPHVHLREPGGEVKETVATATAAAAAGGFTTVLAMPNTNPAPDSVENVQSIQSLIELGASVRVLVCGCLTKGRKGAEVVDTKALAAAGVVALSDDGGCPQTEEEMERVMCAAAEFGLPVIEHAEDLRLAGDGVMHEGVVSKRLGLPGKSSESEVAVIRRDIRLAEKTGAHLHVQHLSTHEGVECIRAARERGVSITAELTPHHLLLAEEAVVVHDVNAKMNPPLRTAADRVALVEGLADGTVTMLATDHAPHLTEEKARGMLRAPNGITGLEAALGIALTELYFRRRWKLADVVKLFTVGPAKLLGIRAGTLGVGEKADFVLFDIQQEWRYWNSNSLSKCVNSPYDGMWFRGKVLATYIDGNKIF